MKEIGDEEGEFTRHIRQASEQLIFNAEDAEGNAKGAEVLEEMFNNSGVSGNNIILHPVLF